MIDVFAGYVNSTLHNFTDPFVYVWEHLTLEQVEFFTMLYWAIWSKTNAFIHNSCVKEDAMLVDSTLSLLEEIKASKAELFSCPKTPLR